MYFQKEIENRLTNIENEIHNLIELERSISNRTVSNSSPQLCSYHLAAINDIAENYSCLCEIVKMDGDSNIHEPPQRDTSVIRRNTRSCLKKRAKRPESTLTQAGSSECSWGTPRSKSPILFQEDVCRQISNIVECMRKSSDNAEQNMGGLSPRHRRDPCPSPTSPKNVSRTSSCPLKCSRQTSLVEIITEVPCENSHFEGGVMQLKAEVEEIKQKIADITYSKRKALDVTNELKTRYDKLINERNEIKKQLKLLQKENKCLCDNLINSIQLQEESNEKVRDAKLILDTYKDQTNRFHEQAQKFSNTLCETKQKFCRCIKEKEKIISGLQTENESINLQLKEKQNSYECICKDVVKLREEICMCNEKIENFSETNKKLSSTLEKMSLQLESTKCESNSYQEKINNCKGEMEKLEGNLQEKCKCEDKLKAENQILQNKLKKSTETEQQLLGRITKLEENLTEKCKCVNNITDEKLGVENELKEYGGKNSDLQTEILKLQCKIHHLEDILLELDPNSNDYDELKKENEKLFQKYIEACKQITIYEGEKKKSGCQCSLWGNKEENWKKETEELRNLVHELTCVVKHNKVALLNMASTNKQQRITLDTQANCLREKENQLKDAESQIECLRYKISDLEKQICCLEKTLENLEGINDKFITAENSIEKNMSMQGLTEELDNIKNELVSEQTKLLVQNKIIEDQQNTIQQLKCKLDNKEIDCCRHQQEAKVAYNEMNTLSDELNRTLCMLREEENEKESLYCQLNFLHEQKLKLAHKVDQLEKLVNDYCDNNRNESINYEQDKTIMFLEQQLQDERLENQRHNCALVSEKEKAVHAAKFATQKLLETVCDFQKQTVIHKEVHKMLTGLLREKEEKLAAVTSKMKKFACIMKRAKNLQENISNDVNRSEIITENTYDILQKMSLEDYQSFVDCSETADEIGICEQLSRSLCLCD